MTANISSGGESDAPNQAGNPALVEIESTDRPDDSIHPDRRTVGMDEVFEILKNQRRQHVLRYLAASDAQVTLGELAEEIAARENEKPISQITSQERKRVYVGLYQCHLPKMDDMGAIDFNKPRGTIERGPNINLFEQYLPTEDHTGSAWRTEIRQQALVFSALLVPLVLLVGIWTSNPVLAGVTVLLVIALAVTAVRGTQT